MAITDRMSVNVNITQNKCNLKWNLINPEFRITPLNIWTCAAVGPCITLFKDNSRI